jgi:hypothetical protein
MCVIYKAGILSLKLSDQRCLAEDKRQYLACSI